MSFQMPPRLAVERLAADPSRLRQLSQAFLARPEGEEGAWGERIVIEEGSALARILGTRSAVVNALHRQAVNRIGEGVAAVAREPAGVIQAIEHRAQPFVLGVQWHPEYLPQEKIQQRIFRELVAQARERRRT